MYRFIEFNRKLATLPDRSRDNLPNPFAIALNTYVPFNAPAIGDLTTLFNFAP